MFEKIRSLPIKFNLLVAKIKKFFTHNKYYKFSEDANKKLQTWNIIAVKDRATLVNYITAFNSGKQVGLAFINESIRLTYNAMGENPEPYVIPALETLYDIKLTSTRLSGILPNNLITEGLSISDVINLQVRHLSKFINTDPNAPEKINEVFLGFYQVLCPSCGITHYFYSSDDIPDKDYVCYACGCNVIHYTHIDDDKHVTYKKEHQNELNKLISIYDTKSKGDLNASKSVQMR
jgi:hypothetical protein